MSWTDKGWTLKEWRAERNRLNAMIRKLYRDDLKKEYLMADALAVIEKLGSKPDVNRLRARMNKLYGPFAAR